MKTRDFLPSIEYLVDHCERPVVVYDEQELKKHIARVKNWMRSYDKPEHLTSGQLRRK